MNDYGLYTGIMDKYQAVLAKNFREKLLAESDVEQLWANARKGNEMNQSFRQWEEFDDPDYVHLDPDEAIEQMTPLFNALDHVKLALGVVNQGNFDMDGELKTWLVAEDEFRGDELSQQVAIDLMTPPQYVDKLEGVNMLTRLAESDTAFLMMKQLSKVDTFLKDNDPNAHELIVYSQQHDINCYRIE